MIKHIFLCLICVLLLIPCTVFATEELPPARVSDGDNLIEMMQEAELCRKLDAISEQYDCDIIVATVPTMGSYDVEEYSDKFYADMNYGMGEYKDGFMLLICLEYRDWALTSYGNAGEKFTYSKITDIRETILPYLADDEFYDAFNAFADECEYILADYGYEPSVSPNNSSVIFNPLWILIALGIGILIAFITVFIMKSQLKSVRSQPAANNYLKSGSLHITHSRDIFLYSTISRRAKPQQTSAGKIGAAGPRQSGKF